MNDLIMAIGHHLIFHRFIVSGNIGEHIVNGSAIPFRYDLEYELTQELTENVSDHYPIEVLIQGIVLIIKMCMRIYTLQ